MISERLNSTHVKCNKIITINCHHFMDKFFSVPNHQTPQKEENMTFYQCQKSFQLIINVSITQYKKQLKTLSQIM